MPIFTGPCEQVAGGGSPLVIALEAKIDKFSQLRGVELGNGQVPAR